MSECSGVEQGELMSGLSRALSSVEGAGNAPLTAASWLEKRGGGGSPMDRLFNRLDGMYPNRWRANFASEQAIANWRQAWAAAFAEIGMTLADVADALSGCLRSHDWPPSLPEFIKLCRPPVSPEAAWHEAGVQMARRHRDGGDRWSHPAVFWAAADFGSFDLGNLSWARAEARWKKTLAARLAQRCGPVPPAMLALPAPGESTPDADGVARMLAAARAAIKRVPMSEARA